ncbi:unnamed protein product [Blepharisma stoltei]|uniref:Receptor ligand binding region domain-containing protein n=1 Tax=Blepharisma stoltei TaxID=1481888 RepID=A0AAU9J162_9CILI|nr:unnamed protein product [Blepharisma stoltei]
MAYLWRLRQNFQPIILLFTFFQLSVSLEIILAYEDNYNLNSRDLNVTSLLEVTQSLTSQVDWHNCRISNLANCVDYFPNSLIILDLSENLDTRNAVSHLCKSHMIIHFVLQSDFRFQDDLTFSLASSKNKQINAFLSVLDYLNWTQGVAIKSIENHSLKEELKEYSSNIDFLTVESQSNIEELVNRVVVRQGATVYYIFTSSLESLELLKWFQNAKLLTAGNGIILDQESGYQCNINGTLIVTEFGQEFAASPEEYLKKSIINVISYILSQISNETAQDILSVLQKYQIEYKFSLVNIQNGARVIVGSIVNNIISISNNMTFPGNSNSIPKSTKKILNLSINAGSTNPNAASSTSGEIGSWGAYFAMDEINEGNTFLQNFQLQFFSFDCGVTVYDSQYAYNCYSKNINKLGLGQISPFSSSNAIGALQTFKKLNVTLPVVGCSVTEPSLNSTTSYPMFTRVWFTASYGSSYLSVLLKAMGWEKVSVLYQNNSWGFSKFWYLNPAIESQGLEIVNPENTWWIPAGLNRESLKNYTDIAQGIINSQARLLVLSIEYPMCNYFFELLYDLGLRKGDLITIATYLDTLTVIGNIDNYRYKRLEVGIPTMRLSLSTWVGTVGQAAKAAKAEVTAIHKQSPTVYTCSFYDGTYLLAHALDYMINRGIDYKDPNKLESIIRIQQFIGCTGRIATDSDSNDRIVDSWDIETNEIDSEGNVTTQVIGTFKPFSSHVFTISNSFFYPDGTTIKPSDLRNENSKCPFPEKLVKTFAKGRALLFGICFFVAVVTFAITLFIWKKWWNITNEDLKQKEEISLQDTVVAISIVIEFFQYSSMGPNFSILSPFIANFSGAFSLNLGDIIKLENGVFWILVDIVFGGILLWAILCAVILLRLDEKWNFLSVIKFLSWLADYLMPILGNLCFIPFISICLDIFLCDQSIGDNFTDSFLARDCYYFCWKDEHLTHAILSFLALFLYVPFAIFCRPLWQELQGMLHVKTSPTYLMVKTIFQITLIVMNKTIKRSQDITHGCLFVTVLIGYIIFTFKFKPYNYARFSWWQGLVLIGVAWLAFISTIAIGIQNYFTSLLAILFLGWVIIIIVGLYKQKKKYPSLLFRKSAKDTSTLFKFAFTFGKSTGISKDKVAPY